MKKHTAEYIIKDFCKDVFNVKFDRMLFVCIRGVLIRDNKFEFNENALGEWNDTIWLFDKHYSRPYDGTVDPSDHWVRNPMGAKGAVRVLPGVTVLRLGIHRSREAFVQTGDVLVYRDTTKNGTWENKDMTGGSSRGINLHAAHDVKDIGRDSAGCTVPKLLWSDASWRNDFIARGKKSGQVNFYRVFIEAEELAKYIGLKYSSNPPKDYAHILYENRQGYKVS